MLQNCLNCSYGGSASLPMQWELSKLLSHSAFTCLESAIETLEQGEKPVQN